MSTTRNSTEAFEVSDPVGSGTTETGEAFVRPLMVAFRSKPAWLDERLQKIELLNGLEPNWDSYGASPVSRISIQVAKAALRELCRVVGVQAPTVSATPDGHVSLSWSLEHSSLDVDFTSNGRIEIAYLDECDACNDWEGITDDLGRVMALLTKW